MGGVDTVCFVSSSESMSFTEGRADFQKHLEDGTAFPIVLNPYSTDGNDTSSLISSATKNLEWLDSTLAKSGAIVFKGFDVSTVEDFNRFVEALGWEDYNYTQSGGKAMRTNVYKRVSTVNENIPVDKPIGLHSEASYVEEFPKRVMFYCEAAPLPGTGGETPIAHGHSIYMRLFKEHKPLLVKLMNKGIKLTSSSGELNFPSFPAFRENRLGQPSWFNQFGVYAINFNNFQTAFGDGTMFTKEELEICKGILEDEKVKVPWSKGDIVMLDNTTALHGREPCTGPIRSIFIALTK